MKIVIGILIMLLSQNAFSMGLAMGSVSSTGVFRDANEYSDPFWFRNSEGCYGICNNNNNGNYGQNYYLPNNQLAFQQQTYGQMYGPFPYQSIPSLNGITNMQPYFGIQASPYMYPSQNLGIYNNTQPHPYYNQGPDYIFNMARSEIAYHPTLGTPACFGPCEGYLGENTHGINK